MDMQTTILIPLEQIHPNPWQTRLADDPAHVSSLAEDIRVNGLLQPPLARSVNSHYEIAFGHTRLAAFRLLDGQGVAEFDSMPVMVRQLTDRQMADMAAVENARRKDLSGIETARALERRIKEFGLSQAEAGGAFGLTQSAVAQLIRLLRLPEPIQQLVHRGELPERQARRLVVISHLMTADDVDVLIGSLSITDDVSAVVEGHIEETLERRARLLMEAPWELDAVGLGQTPACKQCEHYLRIKGVYNNSDYCANPECYSGKFDAALELYARNASEKHGIPVEGDGEMVRVMDEGERAVMQLLQSSPEDKTRLNLRIMRLTDPGPGAWWLERIFSSRHICLGVLSVSFKDVIDYLHPQIAIPQPPPARPAQPPPAPKAPAASQVDKKAEKERAEQERAERVARINAEREAVEKQRLQKLAADRRAEHDMVWMVIHASKWMAEQLDIRGRTLQRVLDNTRAINCNDPLDNYGKELSEKIRPGYDAADDGVRRQLLALRWLTHEIYDDDPDHAREIIEECALSKTSDAGIAIGLALKAPAGWDRPPIHQTDTNCWQCGVFAPTYELTDEHYNNGWGEDDDGAMFCSEACLNAYHAKHKQPAKKPTTKPAAKPARKAAKK